MLVIAVHGGAGSHSSNKDVEAQIKSGLKSACSKAQQSFQTKQDACQAVRDSIISLEDDAHFNAGTGSNLTIIGTVECDASIMNAAEDFGAVGAVRGIKNPIALAYDLLAESQVPDPHGRIHPMLIAGKPVATTGDPFEMITPKSRSEWDRWKSLVDPSLVIPELPDANIMQDTVGAIACTVDGDVSAGVSSGGILLKHPGRVGEAGIFGAGCWASGARGDRNAVACSVSGAGEMIMRGFLAKELSEAVRHPERDIHEEIERVLTEFKEMCVERGSEHANVGVILIVVERQDTGVLRSRLWCGFTTASFAIAYATSIESAPKAVILRRPGRDLSKPGLYITSLPL
ncbi:N-terminal nucleophile aminohydrolase [Ceratobasidium sp. AG-I]|nr:N-terminal nucleophile aminohydrolase [Ceratobasidium sp. AG-I]